MIIFFMVLFLGGLVFFLSSFHSLVILLFVEIMILGCLLIFFYTYFTWFFCLMFLCVGVCLGAYGVSLLVSISRMKGSNYFFSF